MRRRRRNERGKDKEIIEEEKEEFITIFRSIL